MAVLDFPASPLAGDKYPVTAVPGQPQYTYDGVKWTTIGAQISNAAPATALPLMDAATALVGTATKYAREDHVHPRFPAAPIDALAYSGMQVNGSMEVSQERGANVASGAGVYHCDVWKVSYVGTMAVSGVQATTGGIWPGFSNTLALTVGTAQASFAAGDFAILFQSIEGYRTARLAWGTASAQSITIGFWTSHNRTGLYSGSVRNGANNRSYVFTYTQNVSAIPQYNVVTIPGDTTGTWSVDNTTGILLTFSMGAGNTQTASSANSWLAGGYQAAPGQINAVAATSDVFRITGVVVLPGIAAPTAAQSPLIMRPFDQELLTCKRYWYPTNPAFINGASFGMVAGLAKYAGLNSLYFHWQHPVPMRATPTYTLWNNGVQNQMRNGMNGTRVSVTGAGLNTVNTGGFSGLSTSSGTPFTLESQYDFDLIMDARL